MNPKHEPFDIDKLIHKPQNFVAGQVSKCLNVWQGITDSPWVLQQIQGIELPFVSKPVQKSVPSSYKLSLEETQKIDIQIEKMLDKKVIEETEHSEGEWISNVFPRPKPDGEVRVILDLTQLNKHIEYCHFKMSALSTALDLMQVNSFMSSLDMKDAYYSVPVCIEHRKYLRFYWAGVLYQYAALPNGLACAPRYFTKIMSPIFAKARCMGIECFQYIDDVFVIADTEQECQAAVSKLAHLLDKAGLVIHPVKSSICPSTTIRFLGFMLDSKNGIVYLPEDKVQKMEGATCEMLSQRYPTIQKVAEIVGLMTAYTPAVDYGKAHIKDLERDKNSALVRTGRDYSQTMSLSQSAVDNIVWWLEHAESAFRIIRPATPDITMETDASLQGWGAVVQSVEAGGRWTEKEIDHINVLELRAIYLGLRSFLKKDGQYVHVSTDNMTARAYVAKGGGVRSAPCHAVAKLIWTWLERHKHWVTISYLPGVLNVAADKASRVFADNLEWSLGNKVFERICKIFGVPEIDLFASRNNNKCAQYVSFKPDPGSLHVDAFTMSWSDLYVYIFPPCSLLLAVLRKIQMDQPRKAIVVAPRWSSAPWFTRVNSMAKRRLVIGRKRSNIMPNQDFDRKFPKGISLIISQF